MPILDSSGKPVKISARSVDSNYEGRDDSLKPQGKTMLSKFSGMSSKEIQSSYTKLAADIESANPSIRSPLLNQSNFYMPESDSSTGEPNRLLNQWIAYYVKWHPMLGNLLSLHAELPLSRFALRGIDDPKILQFYEDMVESAELHLKMVELLKNYFTFGEVFPYAFWSDEYNCFTDLTFLDSNFVFVKGHYLLHSEEGDDVQFFELEPDPMLRNIVQSDDYVTSLLRESLDPEFVAAVRQNKRLMLSNFSTSMLSNKIKYSDIRGTSIVLRCLKRLLYQDKLYEAQYAIADAHVNPKWIWKLGQAGDLSTGGYMPTEEDLDAFRELLVQANNDPIFTIITHYAVNVDAVGLAGKILPIQPELQQIKDDILTALFSNEAVTTGQGPNFATASVAFRAMMSRYIPIRAKVDRFLYHKIFAPVAYANKFYKRRQCDLDGSIRTGDDESNQLIIPQIDWRSKTNLMDDGSVKSIIASAVNTGRLPVKTLVEALDLDYNEVRNYLWNEQGSVFDSVAIDNRKKNSQQYTDQTLMGQPFLPKSTNPVNVPTPNPQAKSASKLDLNIQPLNKVGSGDNTEKDSDSSEVDSVSDGIQKEVDKAQKGSIPKAPDPYASAVEAHVFDSNRHNKKISEKVLKKRKQYHDKNEKCSSSIKSSPHNQKQDVERDGNGNLIYMGYVLNKSEEKGKESWWADFKVGDSTTRLSALTRQGLLNEIDSYSERVCPK